MEMRSDNTTVVLVMTIIGLMLVMLHVPVAGSSSSTDDYATAVFGVS
jgi:hypothetical protein